MNHTRFMDATKALEDALKVQERARAVWLVSRVAHPAVLDVTVAEMYCEASNAVAMAQDRYDEAVIEAQSEYFRTEFGRRETA